MVKHALIIGSSGIIGFPLSEYLLLCRDWKVTGVARKDYEHRPERLNLFRCDVSDDSDVKKLAELKDVTHLFYVLWVPGKSEEEQCKVNKRVFQNVLTTIQQGSKNLQYVYLQTGNKHYGMHMGPTKGMIVPFKEENARLPIPNFYYDQEDVLFKEAQGKSWSWNIVRPPSIVGFTLGTPMNIGMCLGVYATIMKELGQPLIFPYGEQAWVSHREFVDAKVVCKFIAHLAPREVHDRKLLCPITANEIFNISNGDYYTPQTLWPKLADYFGMPFKLAEKPFKAAESMKDKEDVWNRVVQKYNLKKVPYKNLVNWEFMDLCLGRPWNEATIIQKAVKSGFTELESTESMFVNFFDGLTNMNIIPRNGSKLTASE
jgi:nucleoside-diphosphate-sugar epimerase